MYIVGDVVDNLLYSVGDVVDNNDGDGGSRIDTQKTCSGTDDDNSDDDNDDHDHDLYIIGRFCLSVCHEK